MKHQAYIEETNKIKSHFKSRTDEVYKHYSRTVLREFEKLKRETLGTIEDEKDEKIDELKRQIEAIENEYEQNELVIKMKQQEKHILAARDADIAIYRKEMNDAINEAWKEYMNIEIDISKHRNLGTIGTGMSKTISSTPLQDKYPYPHGDKS